MENSFSFKQAFNDGWESFKANMGIAIGGYALMFVIGLAFAIPIIGALAALVVMGPLLGGYLFFFLKVSKNEKPEIGDLFTGFSRFGQFLGMFWLFILIYMVCYIPGAIIMGIGAAISGSSETIGLIVMMLGGIVAVVVLAVIGMRYCLAFFVLVDESGDGTVMGALAESKKITEGVKLKLFGSFILISLLSSLGYLALFVGILFTAPLAACVACHIYFQLRNGGSSAVDSSDSTPELAVDSE